jgi:LCP family protein required for cell wall assembly
MGVLGLASTAVPRPRLIPTFVALALVAGACGASGPPEEITTTSLAATTTATTNPPPPTTSATTTVGPPRTVTAGGDLPTPILTALGALYSWLADERNPAPPVPAAMLATLDAGQPIFPSVAASGVVHELENGDSVAVVHVAGDVLFMVEDEQPWRIAGAVLVGEQPWLGESPRLLLVLGSDARKGENQRRLRADSIHIVGVDPSRSEGSIVGFPRDSWVEGPAGKNKFTNIMAGRGPEVMLDTAEALTALDLDGYVVTGFAGFEGLIKDLGGLTIDLPQAIRSGIEGWQNYPSGVQKLGPTALLRLARIRKTLNGGDFARSVNHGLIMLAGMIAVQEMGVDELPRLLDTLLEHTWTDLSTEDLLTMAATVYILTPEDMVNMVLPGSVGTAGDRSVVFLAESATNVYLDLADGVIDEP